MSTLYTTLSHKLIINNICFALLFAKLTVLSISVKMPSSKSRSSRRKNRPDTPMPTSRHCGNCGNRHAAPTGKKCAVAAARAIQAEEVSNLCEDEIRQDLDNRASSSPVASPVQQQAVQEFTMPANISKSMDLLADNLVLLRKEMASLRSVVLVV